MNKIALASGGLAALGLGTLWTSRISADSAAALSLPITPTSDGGDDPAQSTFRTLLRTYVVYSMCSMPALVDNAPRLLEVFTSVPGLRWITEALVRITFFDQVFIFQIVPCP
jgi:proline dehydrogenase